MLDMCQLVSVDEDIMKKEEERIKLRRFKANKKSAKIIQKELEFIEACFNGNIEKVKDMMTKDPVSANS